MNFSDKLFLSGHVIKSAFEKQAFPGALAQGLKAIAKPLASRVLGSPALRSAPMLRNSATSALGRAAPSVERQVFQSPAIQRIQQRAAQGTPRQITSESPARLIQRSSGSGSYAPRQPILSNVPDVVPAAAAPALAAIAPAAAAAMPTGLGLARQGLGQVMTGAGQAIRGGAGAIGRRLSSGAAAARSGLSSGASAVRSGLVSAAKNPLVQAGAVGLGAGALGAYGVNRAMGVGGASPADSAEAAAPAATAPASVAPTSAGAASGGAATGAGPAGPAAAAVGAGVANTASRAGIAAAPAAAPAAPAAAPAADNTDYNAAFKRYMGSSFDSDSKLDRAKMDYLKGLKARNIDLNAANIYNPAYGYDQF